MVLRQIELDEESDRILSNLSQAYEGDAGRALGDLPQAHEGVEAMVAQCEELHAETLLAQRERAERGFREGRFTTWDEVKRKNAL